MANIFGHERAVYFDAEATYGLATVPAAGDALRTTSFSFGAGHGTFTPNDRKGTLDPMERIVARQPLQPWSLAGIVRPSGALGTASDIGDLLTHTFGTQTVTGSTSVAYTLLEDKTSLSATIMALSDNDILVGVSGAVVQQLGFAWGGEQEITWSASGVAAKYIQSGRSPSDGIVNNSDTTVAVDDASYFSVGGTFAVVNPSTEAVIDSASGAGYSITSISGQTLTFTPAAVTGWADNDLLVPFLPAATYSGDALYGTDGSVSIDGGSGTIKTESGSIAHTTGLGIRNSSFGSTEGEAVILEGERSTTFDVTMLVDTTNTYLMQDIRANTAYDMQIILGDTAAKRYTFNMDNAFLDPEAIPSADFGVLPWTIHGTAYGTSGEDSIDMIAD